MGGGVGGVDHDREIGPDGSTSTVAPCGPLSGTERGL
jgi:hypothetical protein